MGYTTDFEGAFQVTPPLKPEDREFLAKFAETRRMARKVDPKYGVEGEFYVDGKGSFGQDKDETVIDYNTSPKTQPGLWCQWAPSEDGTEIVWDGSEKFYNYVEWIKYLIEKILAPRGYVLNGEVKWQGEESSDLGIIEIAKNKVSVREGRVVYGKKKKV